MPDLALEQLHWRRGASYVAGVDEAGRGCLAGPVVAAAVVLPPDVDLPDLDDSKKLSPELREDLFARITDQAVGIGVGRCVPDEIDRLNILWASLEAMRRAVLDLALPADVLLIDGNRAIPEAPWPQETVIGGDGRSLSIAAASVIAKVSRDRLMTAFDSTYPEYGFPSHKGYATRAHYEALAAHGPTPLHRRSFKLGGA
jgi:ribonuclease HII